MKNQEERGERDLTVLPQMREFDEEGRLLVVMFARDGGGSDLEAHLGC